MSCRGVGWLYAELWARQAAERALKQRRSDGAPASCCTGEYIEGAGAMIRQPDDTTMVSG